MNRCWSFSQTGARCEFAGGHDGKHAMSVEWSDAEAWQPTMVEMTKTKEPIPVVGYPDLPKTVLPCAACGWTDPATHEDNPYDCREYVG
jgi:hypothetical protein